MNGYCLECCRPYEAERVVDGICPRCKALDPRNDPAHGDDIGPSWKYSKPAMRERLGVIENVDE